MHVIGIDLSGPTNVADTALSAFRTEGDRLLSVLRLEGVGDLGIIDAVRGLAEQGEVVVGLDAPLSYQPGGGSRDSDSALRKRVIGAGMKSGSVMPPTFNRMAYLTLRGISVARSLETLGRAAPKVVEVHPGAALVLGGAPLENVLTMKAAAASRRALLDWLEQQGLEGISGNGDQAPSDHFVAAGAAALAAWKWSLGKSVWCFPAEPPLHPYDFAV